MIDADLQEALKLTVSFADKRWRASRASVNAFAARYYLYRGNYTEAEKCANMALGEFSELVDYTTISRYLYRTYSVPTSDGQISLFPVYILIRISIHQNRNWNGKNNTRQKLKMKQVI